MKDDKIQIQVGLVLGGDGVVIRGRCIVLHLLAALLEHGDVLILFFE